MSEVGFVVPAAPRSAIEVEGASALFPVRRIYCVGRNYTDHVKEMGGDVRDPPFFFQKPTDAVVHSGENVPYPSATSDFHHEVEYVLAIGKGGSGIRIEDAEDHVLALAVGIDLTRRDRQTDARNVGRPWEIGKAFDRSAPVGALRLLGDDALSTPREISLHVNGVLRQQSNVSEMIWSPAEIVSRLSEQYRLEAGDIIFTGTPAGVGPLVEGDVVDARIEGLPALRITIGGQ